MSTVCQLAFRRGLISRSFNNAGCEYDLWSVPVRIIGIIFSLPKTNLKWIIYAKVSNFRCFHLCWFVLYTYILRKHSEMHWSSLFCGLFSSHSTQLTMTWVRDVHTSSLYEARGYTLYFILYFISASNAPHHHLTTLERSTKLITFRAICIELVCMLNSSLDVVIWSEATSKTSESINLLQSILKKSHVGRRQSVNVCGWELKTLI